MSNKSAEKDYLRIIGFLDDVRDSVKTTYAAEGTLIGICFLFALSLISFALDNLLWLSSSVRISILIATLAVVLFLLLFKVILPVFKKNSDENIAVKIEKAYPELDNRLINAVQLGRCSMDSYAGAVRDKIVIESKNTLTKINLSKVVDKKRIKKRFAAAAFLFVALIVYYLILPLHFVNAFRRFSQPCSYVSPITRTKLSVEPGDTSVKSGDNIVVKANVSGEIPPFAEIEVDNNSKFTMSFDGASFIYKLFEITSPLKYKVYAGDAVSQEFTINVIHLPTIKEMTVTYHFPDYTGKQPETLKDVLGDIDAVAGSKVNITAECSKIPATVLISSGSDKWFAASSGTTVKWNISVSETTTYFVELTDTEGYSNIFIYQIKAREDSLPKIFITAPKRDITLCEKTGKQRVTINFGASDDIGVRKIQFIAVLNNSPEQIVKTYSHEYGKREIFDSFVYEADTDTLSDKDTLTYFFLAEDGNPASVPVKSESYRIKIISPAQKQQEALDSLTYIYGRLRNILNAQVKNEKKTREIISLLEKNKNAARKLMPQIPEDEKTIKSAAENLAESIRSSAVFERKVKMTLISLSANEMTTIIKEADKVVNTATTEEKIAIYHNCAQLQKKIVDSIKDLLNEIPAIAEQLKKSSGDIESGSDNYSASKQELIKKLSDGLSKFIKEQKKVIEETLTLDKKSVDDWTDGDEKVLEKLIATESDWADFFKDLKSDLSLLPNQDFSDSKLCKELVEIYEEVELAEDALTRRAVEIAVPYEQTGLESAESLEKNIERWLPDVHDYKKWVIENTAEDIQAPLCDLPEELEDIIGELIEKEEDLSEDVDDVSSAWSDSLDKGAGWGTAEGPISNTSARGVTGNTLPDNNEIGGRSGEGRTGRASGQMVEDTATGKGGRTTPTRLTPDPYESGSIRDISKDPAGGSTGGGKLSGSGEEGLRGPIPPQLKEELERLATAQSKIINTAEKLSDNLKYHKIPSAQFEESISIMRKGEECLKNANLSKFQTLQKVIIQNIRDTKDIICSEIKTRSEKTIAIPKEMREDLFNAVKEKRPEAFKELISDYFRTISNPSNEK
ncbi:MAG: hypothetical protein ABIH42_10065 [Planctomycetota bacterium]